MVVRSNSRFAAGVRLPAASDLRGVHDGGSIVPFLLTGVREGPPGVRLRPSSPALARRLLEASFDSF